MRFPPGEDIYLRGQFKFQFFHALFFFPFFFSPFVCLSLVVSPLSALEQRKGTFMKKSCPTRRGSKEDFEENENEDVGRTRWGETIVALLKLDQRTHD